MIKYMQPQHNQRQTLNISGMQNMWPQRNYLPNRHHIGPPWTPSYSNIDFNFWCETCDKGFRTAAHLDNHTKLHQKCNIDGCQFVAHPKVITKHIQMQHATGLFKKIGKLNNPEEIKKWREERKKKYPTKLNIEKKQAEMKEREKRGERLGLPERKKKIIYNKELQKGVKHHTSIMNNRRAMYNRKRTASDFTNKVRLPKKICKTIVPVEDTRKLKPFGGIQDLVNDDHIDVDEEIINSNDFIDDEDSTQADKSQVESLDSKPNLCGALTSLICNYGSSDEDECDENSLSIKETNLPIKNRTKPDVDQKFIKSILVKPIEKLLESNRLLPEMKKSQECLIEDEDDNGPEECRVVREGPVTHTHTVLNNTRKTLQKKTPIKKNISLRKKLPSTLLEKLLHKEIQHERNIILQCVRHVIENNFFE